MNTTQSTISPGRHIRNRQFRLQLDKSHSFSEQKDQQQAKYFSLKSGKNSTQPQLKQYIHVTKYLNDTYEINT